MTKLTAHTLRIQDDNGCDTDLHLATVKPASARMVALVAAADENDPNGRSQFVWVRLQNGDLILGVYPQGDTYFACEEEMP